MAEETERDGTDIAMIYQHLVTMPDGTRKVLTASRQLDSDTVHWMTGGSLAIVQSITEAEMQDYADACAELDLAKQHDAIPSMGDDYRACDTGRE